MFLALWRGIRRGKVWIPRASSQASNGWSTMPKMISRPFGGKRLRPGAGSDDDDSDDDDDDVEPEPAPAPAELLRENRGKRARANSQFCVMRVVGMRRVECAFPILRDEEGVRTTWLDGARRQLVQELRAESVLVLRQSRTETGPAAG